MRNSSWPTNFEPVARPLEPGDRSPASLKAQQARASGLKTVRDLSEKIDLMPPLSLEQGSKRLILAKKLDRENLDKYLHSSSGGSLSQSSSASLTVHVKCQLRTRAADSNNNEPEQQQQWAANGTGEPSGERGANFSATSAIKRPAGPNGPRARVVNSILIPVHLIITDENDNWPVFSPGPYIIDLNETAPVGSLLQNNEIIAFDNDQPGPLSTIEYSIVPGSFWSDSFGFLNPLDSRSLIVKDNRLLDFESQPKILLKVMARDQGDPANWAISSLYVNLLDQDDTGPVFSEDKYQALVRDNRPGEKIQALPRRLVALDGDRALSAPISYTFHLNTAQASHFELDPELGQLTLRKSFEQLDTLKPFCLLIRASQVDNPRRWSLTALTIKQANANKQTDEQSKSFGFAQANYTVEMSEAASVGATIFTARANLGAAAQYELLDNDLGFMEIEPNSGRVTLNKTLDYEMFRRLSVRILATAKLGAPSTLDRQVDGIVQQSSYTSRLVCDITRLNVDVLNFNDYAPEFSHELYNFQLAISDLIANFEPSAPVGSVWAHDELAGSGAAGSGGHKLSRRMGELELGEEVLEEFDRRSIQLGQVYCADRDHGDRVALQLTGSRANLFHLAQDGRLYLPLTNTSSSADGPAKAQQQQPSSINNQLVMNRIFASSRRSDERAQEQPDRAYLNYLLSELSNLGRVRLKVHASDQGQPDAKRSTALIVVSIISIDNFIIQRSAISPPGSQTAHTSDESNSANETLGPQRTLAGRQTLEGGEQSEQTSQMMMIPSVNGKSFVHINADIVGNLLTGAGARPGGAWWRQGQQQQPDPLEPSPSNTVSKSLPSDSSQQQQHNSAADSNENKHAPGLLLVDEVGAKFVAMPTAMEVYERHVQEATSGQQQARMKLRHQQQLSTTEIKRPWYHFGERLGLTNSTGFMQWVNLSTAIALHLIVIVCILSLATRFRLLVGLGGNGHEQDGGSGTSSQLGGSEPNSVTGLNVAGGQPGNRWPKSISSLGSFFADKQDEAAGSMLTRQLTSRVNSAGSSPPAQQQQPKLVGAYSGQLLQRKLELEQQGGLQQSQPPARQSVVSSGALVSAKSGGQLRAHTSEQLMAELSPEARGHQQSLFEHLKLTLDKMLDSSESVAKDARASNIGQISVRPLGSEGGDSDEHRPECCGQFKETSEIRVEQSKRSPVDKSSAISTFVGPSTANQRSNKAQQMATQKEQQNRALNRLAPTIVSIKVGGAGSRQAVAGDANNSSNSSTVSLVSMSSTISNKISAAVVKAGDLGNVTGGSDSTSLNSSILLQACDLVESREGASSPAASRRPEPKRKPDARQPPAPPPLPPPPSLVRATSANAATTNRTAGQSRTSKPLARREPGSKSTRSTGAEVSRRMVAESSPPLGLRRDDQLLLAAHDNEPASRRDGPQQQHDNFPRPEVGPDERLNLSAAQSRGGAVGGRRETRIGQQHQCGRPGAMKPREQPTKTSQRAISTPNKTVSPTTSVDRGYESFQSFGGAQPNGPAQYLSLQECCLPCDNLELDRVAASLPEANLGRRVNRLTPATSTGTGSGPQAHSGGGGRLQRRLVLSSARQSDRANRRRVDLGKAGHRLDCDTEDDDFYYYCGESIHEDEHHQVGCFNYSCHAYTQQASCNQTEVHRMAFGSASGAGRATRATPATGARQQTPRKPSDLRGSQLREGGGDLVCDMAQKGRRGPQLGPSSAGRAHQLNGGVFQSSQLASGEVGVKRLTWSDQVH